jgi:hypothetical protein
VLELTISMLTRQALDCLRRDLAGDGESIQIIDIAKPGMKIAAKNPISSEPIMQKTADVIIIETKELALSLDEFGAKYIEPAMTALADEIRRDGIRYTHPLLIPSGVLAAARHAFDGISMRGLMEERMVWSDNLPRNAIAIRFDVQYSK